MAGKAKRPKTTRIRSVDQLQPGVPRQVVPIDQIAPYYGGRAGAAEAVRRAGELQQQVYPNMADIDPEMMELFPPFAQGPEGDYRRPSTLIPIQDPDPAAPLSVPVGYMDDRSHPDSFGNPEAFRAMPSDFQQGAVVNLSDNPRDFSLMDSDPSGPEAISQMIEQPMTTNITDPMGVNLRVGGESGGFSGLRGTPLISEDEASELARALTENVGGDPQAIAETIMDRSRPYRVDQALAQLRRTSGDPMGDMNDILTNAQIDTRRAVNQGQYPGFNIGKSGLGVADLIALAYLPSRVRKFLPTRMGMIPGVAAGTAAGAAAGQYSMSQDPNMIGRSTMGGVTY